MAPSEAGLLHSLAIMLQLKVYDLHPFIVLLRNVPQFCRQQRNIEKVRPRNEDKFIFQTLFGQFTVLLPSVLSRQWQITKEVFPVPNACGRTVHSNWRKIYSGREKKGAKQGVNTKTSYVQTDMLLCNCANLKSCLSVCCPWSVYAIYSLY
jgi:hypothetical protein